MTDVFLGFLNRSLSAAILIFAIVLIRLVFKKAPKWLLCAPVGTGGQCGFCVRFRSKAS